MGGRIHSLESFGTLDGPGIRFVVFLQGCPLRCRYCHNPDTWNSDGGTFFEVDELFARIESCRNFIRSGGVTLSGGEPLYQSEFALELLRKCRRGGFHTALDTAGSLDLATAQPVLAAADLILLDIKALDEELCTRLTGRGNANTLAVLNDCESAGKPVWIRHVVVPGWTDAPAQLRELADYLRNFHCVEKVELLGFHRMAEHKWRGLGLPDALPGIPELTGGQLAEAQKIFDAQYSK